LKPRLSLKWPALLLALIGIALLVGVLFRDPREAAPPEPASSTSGYTRFASHFTVDSIPGYRILSVVNAWNGSGTNYRWILVDSARSCPDCTLPDSLLSLPRIQIPLRRIVVLSTTQLALLEKLGALDRVIAVGNKNHIYSPAMHQRMDSLQLPAVGNGNSLDLERILTLNPDAVLTFGTGSSQFDDYPRLSTARVPTLLTAEWMESHPLGRMEWIRFMGVLLHAEARADSLFIEAASQYDSLCGQVAKDSIQRPVVLLGYPDGDNWQAGGGLSYMAQFLEDAGARYLWKDHAEPGILSLSLEIALTQGAQAEFWLHPGAWRSQEEIHRAEARVDLLPVWRNGNIYQHSQRMGKNGSIDFYESGIAHPERILADLIRILHPGILPDSTLSYYRRVE